MEMDDLDDESPSSPSSAYAPSQNEALQMFLRELLESTAGSSIDIEGLSFEELQRRVTEALKREEEEGTGENEWEDEDEDGWEDEDEGDEVDIFDEMRHEDDDADYDDSAYAPPVSAHRRDRVAYQKFFPTITEPQATGLELLYSGEFGRVGNKCKIRRGPLRVAREIRRRMAQARPAVYREDFTAALVPNSVGTIVADYGDNIYTAQYSADSSFFYTCSQDFRLNIFDTTVPIRVRKPGDRRADPSHSLRTNMKVMNSIQAQPGIWSIPDANLSPDNERMVYALLGSTCYVTSTTEPSPTQVPISFSDPNSRTRSRRWGSESDDISIYSCRFSADGNEVIAGGNGQIFEFPVYDLLANRRTVKIDAHEDDVNSCCWADTSSGNVLISASDDTYLKVWDRRSLGASQKPSGVLMGHTEGITYVSAKGDGRYVISNGKDQKLRLWDLRKMRTNQDLESCAHKNYSTNYDYRYSNYPSPRIGAHPMDCSVMAFYGHAVLQTLIRCHFSPAETTGGQYIYSGSADGKVHIWSLDGQIVQILDRAHSLPMSFDPSEPHPVARTGSGGHSCVRDVSWHAYEPVLMTAAWESGRRATSSLARHEWKGLSKMGYSVEDWVAKENA
ncbi:unnamed protein product [Mycena citricolor]|uniref:WD40 repeat-like protein n=1 Tax=Mycena citricolor TaxID=2018698 RepID=A0AAD2HRB8_9AGAR|nr:unnamed protein product [Mycena citricolor]